MRAGGGGTGDQRRGKCKGPRGSLAPDSWVKELAPSPVFCPSLSLSPFLSFKIILNLLSTDAGSQAHPLELEAPLGLTSLAGSPPLSLASKPARVDSHQPSTVSSGRGCSALPSPSQVALGTPDFTIAGQRLGTRTPSTCGRPPDSHRYRCWQANGLRWRRPRGRTLAPKPPAGATHRPSRADLTFGDFWLFQGNKANLRIFTSVFILTRRSCSIVSLFLPG